jgi:hypothetical protein
MSEMSTGLILVMVAANYWWVILGVILFVWAVCRLSPRQGAAPNSASKPNARPGCAATTSAARPAAKVARKHFGEAS